MKKFVLVWLIVFCNSIYAQKINFTSNQLIYLNHINKAELAITTNSLRTALAHFDSAFQATPKHRDIDRYNKAVCYRKIGKNKQADSLFVLLASRGFRSSYIYNCFDTLGSKLPKKQPLIVNGKNLDEFFEQIFNEDQKANTYRFLDMEKYAHIQIENAKLILKLADEIDNFLAFDYYGKLYFPIHNFLQIRGIGNRVKSDSLFKKQYVVYKSLLDIDFEEIKFYEFMVNEVAKGNYDHETFAGLMGIVEYWFGEPITQYNEYVVVRPPNTICNEDLYQLNQTRQMFGLESYEDFYKKAWYTDSLITNGKPFTVISDFDEYIKQYELFQSSCEFSIAKDYRNNMEFSNPEDAKRVYEHGLKSLCP